MYGLIIFTLLSFTIGDISSTETENVDVVPVVLNYTNYGNDESTYVGNFIKPLKNLNIIKICGENFSKNTYVRVKLQGQKVYVANDLLIEINGNNIAPDTSFCVSISIADGMFNFTVNGKSDYQNAHHAAEYYKIVVVDFKQGGGSLTFMGQLVPFPNTQTICVPANYNDALDIAFQTYFQPMLKSGQIISIIGKPSGSSAGQFSIDFTGYNEKKVLFRFNPRFAGRTIVLNSMNDNLSWGLQVQTRTFPFQLNQQFKIAFGLTERSFVLAANGVNIATFNYRQNNLLDILNGFAVKKATGMEITISSVEYLQSSSPNLENIAEYSKL